MSDLQDSTVTRKHRHRLLGRATRRMAGIASIGLALLAASAGLSTGPTGSAPAGAAALDLPTIQALYAQDLLDRANAERVARTSPSLQVPPLLVDAGLAAQAQAWSVHLAATGVAQDPPLSACGSQPSPGQICMLAANTGNSGNGTWPGDGSDGMHSDYMASAGHRQNMLNAGYDVVGMGVTCSGGQAWTVEVFGFAYGNLGAAQRRQTTQNAVAGDPVAPGPSVAGLQTGVPVYCPGQKVGPNGQTTATGGPYPYPYAVPSVPGAAPPTSSGTAVGIASVASGGGYWVARSDGSVSSHGMATDQGSMAGQALAAPVRHIVGTPTGRGYWLVASDGGIFSYGDAAFYGSMGGQRLNSPVVDMTPTATGRGYWLVASDGGIFAFGDAVFYGSTGGLRLNSPVVGLASSASGRGYWLVASDGGIFAFGDAPFVGSTGALSLNAAIVGMASSPHGLGYWLVATDGGIFAFGDAPFQGSAGAIRLAAPIAGMASDATTGGYWMVADDGGVFAFGAPFQGAG